VAFSCDGAPAEEKGGAFAGNGVAFSCDGAPAEEKGTGTRRSKPYRDRQGADARWLRRRHALAREAPSVTDHVGVLGIRSLALAVR
jgi:hypothetical protein